MQRLRRYFITGFFVTVPIVISIVAIIWIFQLVDGVMAPLYARMLGREVPGLGLVTTIAVIVVIGVLATNVIGRRLLKRTEHYLMLVPVFKTIYAPVRQLIVAFSPDNDAGFKRMVRRGGRTAGSGGARVPDAGIHDGSWTGPEPYVAVYVPTNHLYLGDVLAFPADRVSYPDLSVEQGLRLFLTGGVGLPDNVRLRGVGG